MNIVAKIWRAFKNWWNDEPNPDHDSDYDYSKHRNGENNE